MSTLPDRANVRPLGRQVSDAVLVEAASSGHEWARAEIYLRHGPDVRRLLVRILGFVPEVDDLLQDVFLGALRDLERLRDRSLLRSWLTGMAVLRARKHLRTRRRWSWLAFGTRDELAEVAAPIADDELRESMAATYRILARMGTDERVAFALRFVEGMELLEVAAACQVSLATAKRRLRRAEDFFRREAAAHPLLAGRLRGES